MVTPEAGRSTGSNVMMRVRQGMTVLDPDGQEITVRRVYMGAVSERAHDLGQGPATEQATPDDRERGVIDNLAEAFVGDDDMPDEVRQRLLRQGFLQIDMAGLFTTDRYALPEHIESVSGDAVRLNSLKDRLIEG